MMRRPRWARFVVFAAALAVVLALALEAYARPGGGGSFSGGSSSSSSSSSGSGIGEFFVELIIQIVWSLLPWQAKVVIIGTIIVVWIVSAIRKSRSEPWST